MKLLELTGIKNLSDKSIADIAIELIKKNYNSLGNGWFGFVFDNPKKPNEVIKFWLDDPAYEAFLNVAETIKSPHIIKIIKRGSITLNLNSEKEPIKIQYVRLEKLTPIGEHDLIDNIKRAEIFSWIIEDTLESPSDEFINNFVKESDVDISSFSNSTIDFLKICKKVYDLKPVRYDWDLHFGNFMKRGNVLVITDPYAGADFKNTKIKIKEIANIITMYTKTN